tara:strand:- start:399 stop:500 length:102 start_codon:yes stop_codon:yes gene_type:complete
MVQVLEVQPQEVVGDLAVEEEMLVLVVQEILPL